MWCDECIRYISSELGDTEQLSSAAAYHLICFQNSAIFYYFAYLLFICFSFSLHCFSFSFFNCRFLLCAQCQEDPPSHVPPPEPSSGMRVSRAVQTVPAEQWLVSTQMPMMPPSDRNRQPRNRHFIYRQVVPIHHRGWGEGKGRVGKGHHPVCSALWSGRTLFLQRNQVDNRNKCVLSCTLKS